MTSAQQTGVPNSNLPEQLKALQQVQEIDLNILSLTKKKTSLPIQIKALQDKVSALKKRADQKRMQVEEVDKSIRQMGAAIELNQERLTRTNKKLSSVTNPKEFQAANKELMQLQKLNENLEAQKKKLSQDNEAFSKELNEIQTNLDSAAAEMNAEIAEFQKQEQSLDADLQQLKEERNKFLPAVQKATLLQYDRVRERRAGVGIAAAISGRCQACNMLLPPQLFNEVQKAHALCCCPSCSRILFLRAPNETT